MTNTTPLRRTLRRLTRDEAWSRLRSRSVGRLAIGPGGSPDIIPLNFLADESSILIRTKGGALLAAVLSNSDVAFEVDDLDGSYVWSVVIRGTARVLKDEDEIEAARNAPIWTWPHRNTDTFIRISPRQINGRAFDR